MPNPLFDREGRLRNGWKIACFLCALLLLGFCTNAILRLWITGKTLGSWSNAALVLGLTAIFLRFEGRPFASVGLKLDGRWFLELLLGTFGGVALMVAVALLVLACGGFHWQRVPGGWLALPSGAWMFLGVALFEEGFFRGYPFQCLVEGLGEWPALLLGALLFAWVHWGNPGMAGATKAWATLNIALAALLLGLCWVRTRSLALPVGVHLGWNWAQGSLLGFGVSGLHGGASLLCPVFQGRPAWLTGGEFGLEASLPCVLLCALAVVGLLLWKPCDRRAQQRGMPRSDSR